MMRIFIVVVGFMLLFSGAAFSHPPSKVKVVVSDGNTIDVTVIHNSLDLKFHYINRLEVKINGKTVAEKSFSAQEERKFTTAIQVPSLKRDDVVSVVAYCNQWGSKEDQVVVKKKIKKLKKAPISDRLLN